MSKRLHFQLLYLKIMLFLFGVNLHAQTTDVHTIALDRHLPLKSQMFSENTIYKVKNTYDLKGQTIIIPKGCTLKFVGGMISNGEIVGQNTRIIAKKETIFDRNLEIRGTWSVESAYSEWFGAKGNGSDNTKQITAFLNFPARKKVLKAGTYGVKELFCDGLKNTELYAYGAILKYLCTYLDNTPGDHAVLTNYKGTIGYNDDMKGYLHIYGLTIDGNSQNFVYDHNPKEHTSIINHHTLRLVLTDKVVLKDCIFKNSFMTAVMLDVCKKTIIEKCSVINSGESQNYKPVGMWYTWEGVSVNDKVYTNRKWREEPCDSCVVKDSYFENIGGSFASANCRVFECYGNTVKDNRGYAFELSRSYKDRVVDIHDNIFYGVGAAAIDMTHFYIPDDAVNTVKIYNNQYYNLGYDSKRTQPCAKAFLMIYRNKGVKRTGVLDVTIKSNLFEMSPTSSQGLVKGDKFVFEDNICRGYTGEQHSALFFCGDDENTGSYYIKNNTLEMKSGAVSIIRSPRKLEVTGNKVKTSLSPAIVYVQGSVSETEYNISDNEVSGVQSLLYISSPARNIVMKRNRSNSISNAFSRSSSDVLVKCEVGDNSFENVSTTMRNLEVIR